MCINYVYVVQQPHEIKLTQFLLNSEAETKRKYSKENCVLCIFKLLKAPGTGRSSRNKHQ